MSLFASIPNQDESARGARPLADRMRPRTLDEFVGQEHLVGPAKPLRVQIERDDPTSMIFWGPPGTGKTTLAKIIARITKADFIEFSAVLAGIKEIKQVMSDADRARQYGTRTIVFVDEIHRFNKAQQDAFLPHVEKGSIRLIGATTENPSFEINSALLSRCRVYVLKPLTEDEIVVLLRRALSDTERGLGQMHLEATEESLRKIAAYSSGDARSAYNVLEVAAALAQQAGVNALSEQTIQEALQKRVLLYDKGGEEHYNIISALHKSVRNSDPDAALYWLARMLEAGEDPLYIARRVVRMAVEDVGLAEPNALALCMAARDAVDFIGMPEGNLALAQAVVYLSVAPKSNALYTAYGAVLKDVEQTAAEPVPLHLRNAPTSLMKGLGYGKDYQYAHDTENKVADMQCLPDSLRNRVYYRPTNEGVEKRREQRTRMSREAEEARSIQQALLPRNFPLIPGFSVSGLSIPAGSVGGDWYDFIPLHDGRWGLVLADVSGKGTAAALLMSATRGMLRSLAQTGSGPAEVLTRLNQLMIEDFPSGRFVTMVYAELDPSSRVMRIANAGHLAPLLVEPSGHRWIKHEHGLPLGISASKFSETAVTLGEHSRIAFYSDGITEAELDSGEEYGADRLLAQIQSPDGTPDSLLADVRKFTNGTGLRDDATVIMVRARGTESGSSTNA